MNSTIFKVCVSIIVAMVIFPVISSAHSNSMMQYEDANTRFEMMRYMEDSVLGDELHEEMEALMERMMSQSLTENEAVRLAELMEMHPGPHAMMMSRYMNMDMQSGWQPGVMPYMQHGFSNTAVWFWLGVLAMLVWVLVGVLGIAYLWKQLSK